MNKPIEDWMLTAYVFGDLDEDQVAVVEAALVRNPQLQSEVDAIRSTLQTVGAALQEREPYLLSDAQLNRMRTNLDAAIEQESSHSAVAAPVQLVSKQSLKSRRGLWMGLTAIAASGLAALMFTPNLIKPQEMSFESAPVAKQPANANFDTSDNLTAGMEARYAHDAKSKLRAEEQTEVNFGAIPYSDESPSLAKQQTSESLKSGEAKDSVFGDSSVDRAYKQVTDLELASEPVPPPPASGPAGAPAFNQPSSADYVDLLNTDSPASDESKSELSEGIAEKENRAVRDFRQNQSGLAAGGDYGSSYGSAGASPAGPATASAPYGGSVGGPATAGGAYGSSYGSGPGVPTPQATNRGGAPATSSPVGGGAGGAYGGGYAGSGGGMGSYGAGAASKGDASVRDSNAQEYDTQLGLKASGGQSPADGAEVTQWAYNGEAARPRGVELAGKPSINEVAGTEAQHFYSDLYSVPSKKLSVLNDNISGDRFEVIQETPFKSVSAEQVTTFSIDVDTAAYSKVRQAIMETGQLPNPNAVRIEEMINYFDYDYAGPTDDKPFAAHFAAAECPWAPQNKLLRIALQAKKPENNARPVSNIVFLLDVSGSMNEPNKLPLVKKTVGMLARQLGENDRVAIAVYASAEGLVLPSINGINQGAIMRAIDELQAGGSTAGGQGIRLAYKIAGENFIKGGINRVILCTDGDFNVGLTSDDDLVNLVEQNARERNVFLTCLGFGMGNFNDSMMEKITNRGNGIYAMVDTELEARRVMVEQLNGTLMTVAKDVKIQVEFNPLKVGAYRLIGYENRKLANKDFNDDTKDAGDIGAGHSVTALYEIVPAGVTPPQTPPQEEPLRYTVAEPAVAPAAAKADLLDGTKKMDPALAAELLTVRLRYKKPEENVSSKLEFPLTEEMYARPVDQDFRWASAIAQFGTLLRRSPNAANLSWTTVQEQASAAAGSNPYRLEAVELMRRAAGMAQPGAGYGDGSRPDVRK